MFHGNQNYLIAVRADQLQCVFFYSILLLFWIPCYHVDKSDVIQIQIRSTTYTFGDIYLINQLNKTGTRTSVDLSVILFSAEDLFLLSGLIFCIFYVVNASSLALLTIFACWVYSICIRKFSKIFFSLCLNICSTWSEFTVIQCRAPLLTFQKLRCTLFLEH